MIRPAVTQNLTTIRQLVDAAYQHWSSRTGRVPGPLRDDYAQRLADAQLWVLEIDGEIVGLVVLVEQSDHLLLENIAVRPDAQGRGYGRQLIAFAEQEAMRRGFSVLHRCTNVRMTENVALYQHLGFTEEPALRRLVGIEMVHRVRNKLLVGHCWPPILAPSRTISASLVCLS